jgi:DNA-binding GntR family transcriptional regulator
MPDFRTDAQKVTDELRESILSGEYAPGDRLPQRAVAEKYGTTTIVAREAIRAVAAEGLAIVEPRFGAMVEEITPRKLEERYIVREALEGMAARLAAAHISPDTGRALKQLADRCDSELRSDRLSRHEKAQLHTELHETIVDAAGCDELKRLLGGLYLHSMIVSNAFHIDWEKDAGRWHSRLIKPIVAGDPDEAEAAMRAHIKRGLEMELAAVTSSG